MKKCKTYGGIEDNAFYLLDTEWGQDGYDNAYYLAYAFKPTDTRYYSADLQMITGIRYDY